MTTKVIRLVLEERPSPDPEFVSLEWETLIWPDGVITDLAGKVQVWTGTGLLKPALSPFSLHRSLVDVEILNHGEEGSGLVWLASKPGDYLYPQFHSPSGKDVYHYHHTEPSGSTEYMMSSRTAMLPVFDDDGNQYLAWFKDSLLCIRVGNVNCWVNHTVSPQQGDTALVMSDDKVIGGTITTVTDRYVLVSAGGKSYWFKRPHLTHFGGVWIQASLASYWNQG